MKIYRLWWHTKRDIKAHLVRCPKYRKVILRWRVAETLRDIIRRICRKHDIKIISWKLADDHVHLFVSYPQTLDVAKMMQYIKWESSYRVMKMCPELKKEYRWGSFRQRGYLAVSSWNITDEMVQEYIESQEGEQIEWEFELEKPEGL